MMGNNFTGMNDKESTRNTDVSNLGLYYMAALDVFHAIKTPGYENFSIRISLFEIYGGKLFDLLNERAPIKCLEDSKGNVCFPGLSEHNVANAEALIGLIEEGASFRSTGTTSRNADSSRSHAVLQLHLYRDALNGRRGKATEFSRLTFIDLAGSERGADTSQASRATRLEGAEINTSLLALKEVIRALATGDSLSHVPFRGSKLTQVLKQSFVGKNCRSVMIACISPNIGNCEQTLNTLRYADRVKERNPETGELSPGMIANTKTTTPIVKHSQSLRSAASSMTSANQSYSSHNSDMLDELLASPQSASDGEYDFGDEGTSSDHQRVVDDLIATHKDALAVMLDMVKEEMTLVNNADADREGLDEYIAKVHAIQDEQLAMISILREQLLQYRLSQANIGHAHGHVGSTVIDVDADDSFEDLRD